MTIDQGSMVLSHKSSAPRPVEIFICMCDGDFSIFKRPLALSDAYEIVGSAFIFILKDSPIYK